ncbi:MAG: hypothetical protein AB7T63_13590 [Planctomycetota bacterium]
MRSVLLFLAGTALGVGLMALLRMADAPSGAVPDLITPSEREALEARIAALVAEVDDLRGGPGLVGAASGDPRPVGDGGASPTSPATREDAEAAVDEAIDTLVTGRLDDVEVVARFNRGFDRLQHLGPVAIEALRARVVDGSRDAAERARALDLLRALDAPRAALLAAGLLDLAPTDATLLASVLAALDAPLQEAQAATVRELALWRSDDPDLQLVAARAWVRGGSAEAVEQVRTWLEGSPGQRSLAAALLADLPTRTPEARALASRALFEEGLLDRAAQARLMAALAAQQGPAWSAAQLVGPPDTALDGDHRSAWASKRPEMGRVELELAFEAAVRPEAVRIHETYNPGAVTEVQVPDGRGGWVSIWSGTAEPGHAPRWFEPAIGDAGTAVRRLRLVLDTDRVSGWNEIDAVELVGDGRRQWVAEAWASSSYAD